MPISNPGGNLNSVPAPNQQTLSTNYLDFTGGSNDWSQQYLPDLMEKEAEVFGPRSFTFIVHWSSYSPNTRCWFRCYGCNYWCY